MSKIIRLSESQFHDFVKKCVNESLNEMQRYNGEYDRTGQAVDDESYVDSFNYLIETFINGNISHAKQIVKRLSGKEVQQLIDFVNDEEEGYNGSYADRFLNMVYSVRPEFAPSDTEF